MEVVVPESDAPDEALERAKDLAEAANERGEQAAGCDDLDGPEEGRDHDGRDSDTTGGMFVRLPELELNDKPGLKRPAEYSGSVGA